MGRGWAAAWLGGWGGWGLAPENWAGECADLGWAEGGCVLGVGGLLGAAGGAGWGLLGAAAGGGLGCSALLGLLAGGCWGLLGAAGGCWGRAGGGAGGLAVSRFFPEVVKFRVRVDRQCLCGSCGGRRACSEGCSSAGLWRPGSFSRPAPFMRRRTTQTYSF